MDFRTGSNFPRRLGGPLTVELRDRSARETIPESPGQAHPPCFPILNSLPSIHPRAPRPVSLPSFLPGSSLCACHAVCLNPRTNELHRRRWATVQREASLPVSSEAALFSLYRVESGEKERASATLPSGMDRREKGIKQKQKKRLKIEQRASGPRVERGKV